MEEHLAEAAHHEPFYADPHVWVAVAFVLFLGLFVKFVLPAITKGLDQRAADIAAQLEQANRLRAEAELLMAATKEQQSAMLQEAESILAQAKLDVKEIAAKAESDLAQTIIRRTAMADEKIERAKINAMQDMRAKMVETATETAREVLTAQLKDQKDDPAITGALQAIARKFH